MESIAFRAALRRQKLAAREALDAETYAALSAQLEIHLARLLECELATSTRVVAFCAPVRKEFDARPLMSRLIAQGWTAVMPVVAIRDAPMTYRRWSPECAMTCDLYGIPIPTPELDLRAAPEIVLCPLVAFDDQGFRLGYGGGYFDRTLAQQTPRPIAVGVGFDLARAPSICPQAHDYPLQIVVTERGVLYYS
ncbi:MAG TPA: 5-formyltetrahydrofolate cyclo-ligase [Rhodocyclaceae bacterium]|nr:5-formyltetrahydrofolate cyclo-ligase [Rhodocyclaceae bacterium]